MRPAGAVLSTKAASIQEGFEGIEAEGRRLEEGRRAGHVGGEAGDEGPRLPRRDVDDLGADRAGPEPPAAQAERDVLAGRGQLGDLDGRAADADVDQAG